MKQVVSTLRTQTARRALALFGLALATGAAGAAGAGDVAQMPTTPEVRSYCQNVAKAAADARFAWQTGQLGELETRVRARIAELEGKTQELRAWISKREEIDRKAGDKLVGIYAKMRPETAATQISTLDDAMAAAVLSRLTPRQASAIFNEIVPERAAKLAGLIAGSTPSSEKKL